MSEEKISRPKLAELIEAGQNLTKDMENVTLHNSILTITKSWDKPHTYTANIFGYALIGIHNGDVDKAWNLHDILSGEYRSAGKVSSATPVLLNMENDDYYKLLNLFDNGFKTEIIVDALKEGRIINPDSSIEQLLAWIELGKPFVFQQSDHSFPLSLAHEPEKSVIENLSANFFGYALLGKQFSKSVTQTASTNSAKEYTTIPEWCNQLAQEVFSSFVECFYSEIYSRYSSDPLEVVKKVLAQKLGLFETQVDELYFEIPLDIPIDEAIQKIKEADSRYY